MRETRSRGRRSTAPGACAIVKPMPSLLFLFIFVPALELVLLITIGKHIGVLLTLGLIVGTGVVGASLARWQGLSVLRKVQEELAAGQIPRDSIVDGILILVAAALLVTPGVLTDVFGFLCLIPGTRALIKQYFVWRFRRAVQEGRVRMTMHFDGHDRGPGDVNEDDSRPGGDAQRDGPGRIIDVKPRDPEAEE